METIKTLCNPTIAFCGKNIYVSVSHVILSSDYEQFLYVL